MSTNHLHTAEPEALASHAYAGQEFPGARRTGSYDEGRLYWPRCSCGTWSGMQTQDRGHAHDQHAQHVAEVHQPEAA